MVRRQANRTRIQNEILSLYAKLLVLHDDRDVGPVRWKDVPRRVIISAIDEYQRQATGQPGNNEQLDQIINDVKDYCNLLWCEEAYWMVKMLSVQFDDKFHKVVKNDQGGISSTELDIKHFSGTILEPSQMLGQTLILDLRYRAPRREYRPPQVPRPRDKHQFNRKNRAWVQRADESMDWRAQHHHYYTSRHPNWLPSYLLDQHPVQYQQQNAPHQYQPAPHQRRYQFDQFFHSRSPNSSWRVANNQSTNGAPANSVNGPFPQTGANSQATSSTQKQSPQVVSKITDISVKEINGTETSGKEEVARQLEPLSVPQIAQSNGQAKASSKKDGIEIQPPSDQVRSIIGEIRRKKPLRNSYRVVGFNNDKRSVKLEPLDAEQSNRVPDGNFTAYLIPDPEIFERCHKALRTILDDDNHILRRVLSVFSSKQLLIGCEDKEPLIDMPSTSTRMLKSRLSKLDPDQRDAVKDILAAKFRPMPYIIFGAPGSGKTNTMIEAIVQIYKRSKGTMKILICSVTQKSTDKLFNRIAKRDIIDESKLCNIPVDILQSNSKIDPDERRKSLSKKTVFLATTVRSGIFLDKSFDYVFVDNASGAHVPETLVPWCKLKDDGCLVMVGDPNQLCTRAENRQVNRGGLECSLLEHFLNDTLRGNYTKERYVRELRSSHRCDARLLKSINRLHYNWRIQFEPNIVVAPARLLIGLKLKHPLVIVDTRDSRQGLAEICSYYIQTIHDNNVKLDQMAVMTIATNDNLADKLRAALKIKTKDINNNKHVTGCRIDRDIDFIGDDKLDVIVVAVDNDCRREDPFGNFNIDNEHRRLNMAITRARWLVIMIGDFSRLDDKSYWLETTNEAMRIPPETLRSFVIT